MHGPTCIILGQSNSRFSPKVYAGLTDELEGDFFLHTTMSNEQRQARSEQFSEV
jgi:hypothetical protein